MLSLQKNVRLKSNTWTESQKWNCYFTWEHRGACTEPFYLCDPHNRFQILRTLLVPIQEEVLLVQEDDSNELYLCYDLCSIFSLSLSSPQTSQGEGVNLQNHG